MQTDEQRLLLYAFLHDIDVFLGKEGTAEFSRQLGRLFPGISADTVLEIGKQEFAEILKAIGEPDRLTQLPETLTSIFSKVSLKEDTKSAPHNFPRRILRFDKSFLNKEDEDLETMRKEFLKEAHCIPKGDFRSTYETLVSLVEKYTAFFPVPHQELDGVSLFDHLRLSAAMAACCMLSDPSAPSYRVVAGELWGLDDFIYNIATPEGHRGQAKGLRGRSFYCLVLTYVMSHFFLHKLGLPITNLLWAGGELFAFLAPNTEDAKAKIGAGEQAINDWFLREHEGRMFLGLAQAEATVDELVKDYTSTFRDIFDQLQQAGRRRFASLWDGSNPDTILRSSLPDPSKGRIVECNICQKDFPENARPASRWPDELENAELAGRCPICQLQYKLGSFLPKVRHYVEICAGAALTKDLQDAEVLFLDFPFGGDSGPVFYWAFPRERRWGDEIKRLQPCLKRQEVLTIRLVRPSDTDFLPQDNLVRDLPSVASFSFSTIANTVPFDRERQVLEFKEIAGQSKGAEYLAALKMDVDHFTRVSTDGLAKGGAKSLVHRMALSRSFSYFLLGYINAVARDYPLSTPEGIVPDSSKIYTVFAGGDDLFLLGPWEVVIDAASRIREDFMRYTGNPQNLTISAGITYFKPTFPIRRFAELTSDALDEKAKKLEDKDALSLFGEVLHWDRNMEKNGRIERLSFATLYDFAQRLAGLVEEKQAGEEVSHSFLMSLLTLKRTSLDQGRIDWQWNLPYLIARAVEGTSAESKKRELLYRFMEKGNLWFRSSEVPLMWVFLKTRRD